MKGYDIAHSELTNSYYIMRDGEKVAECTEQIAYIRADAVEDVIKKLAESEDTILTDKQYYTLMDFKEQK